MIVALFGPPGSGKGTQAAMLAERAGYVHIATGNLLRDAVSKGTPVGLQVRDVLASGALVSDDLVLQILADALQDAYANGDVSVVLDGFPRNVLQTRMLERVLKAQNKSLRGVVFLRVSDMLIEERLTGRFACAGCGAGYHRSYCPTQVADVCDRCSGTAFVQREDDKPDVVRHRLQVYRAETEPVLEIYRRQGMVHEVPAEDDPERVFARIYAEIAAMTVPASQASA